MTHCLKLYELLWPSTVAPAREATSAQAASRQTPTWAHFLLALNRHTHPARGPPFARPPLGSPHLGQPPSTAALPRPSGVFFPPLSPSSHHARPPIPRPSSSRPSLSLPPVSTPLLPRNTNTRHPSQTPQFIFSIPANALPCQSAHGTVHGTWTGSQLTKAVNSLLDSDYRLARMPGSGLHRQLKIQRHGRQLAVNICQTGRVHVQGKGSGHFAQLLSLAHASSMGLASKPSQPSFTSFSSEAPTFESRIPQARQEVPTFPPAETVLVLRFLFCFLLGFFGRGGGLCREV